MIINGVRWRVHLVSPAHPMLLTPWRTHSLGVCDKNLQTIYIDETLNKKKMQEVLCHEIVHAFMYSYNIDLSYEEEEMVAELITTYGEDIFRKTKAIYNNIRMK